jgi:predicted dehydrogenase
MMEVVRSGSLGRLRSIEARLRVPRQFVSDTDIRWSYALAGGAFMDTGVYCVNVMRLLTGEEPIVVSATAKLRSADIDKALEAQIRFPGGCLGHIFSSLDHDGEAIDLYVGIVGEHGTLEINNPFLPQWGHSLCQTVDNVRTVVELERIPTYLFQLREFINVIRNGSLSRTPASDGVLNMRAVDSVYRLAGMKPRGMSESSG